MAERWRNWGGNVSADQISVVTPSSTDELCALMSAASEQGHKVRPIGSGHSFSSVAAPVETQLALTRFSGILAHDVDTGRVRVAAGTRLRELSPALWELGLALPNLGDYDGQTLAGALNTGTHGTGGALPGISAAVVGVELVTGSGERVSIDEQHRPELVPAVALGLGALGVVTAYEVQCAPAFLLAAQERPDRLEAVLEALPNLVSNHDHVEFYWFPHTSRVLTKINTRLPVSAPNPGDPLPHWRRRIDDDLLSNTLFEGINRLATVVPGAISAINQVSARALSARQFTDRSYRVFATDRRVRFTESEWSIPRDRVAGVLTELARWFQRSGQRCAFPLEVRFTGPDDRWLSTSHARESAYIAVHEYHRRSNTALFEAFAVIINSETADQNSPEQAARPHWGKCHELSAEDLRPRYPRFDEFVALRDQCDPQRVLTNPYLDRVLGE